MGPANAASKTTSPDPEPRSRLEIPFVASNPLPLVEAIPLPWDFTDKRDFPWTQSDAIALCREIEKIAPDFGAHVALTGGTLYRDGERKDVDILFYRIRQVKEIDKPRLLRALKERLGIQITKRHGWVQKALYQGKPIDFFFPDHVDSERDETGEYA
jgi:hypothetical protein